MKISSSELEDDLHPLILLRLIRANKQEYGDSENIQISEDAFEKLLERSQSLYQIEDHGLKESRNVDLFLREDIRRVEIILIKEYRKYYGGGAPVKQDNGCGCVILILIIAAIIYFKIK